VLGDHKRGGEQLVRSFGREISMKLTSRCVNITVHGIGEADRDLAPGEDETWVDVGQFEQTLDAVVERDNVRITFDDGNASDVQIALPRLLDRGLKAEFFVLAGLLGEAGRLRTDDVRELVRAGMTVGSHGWAHRDWRRIDREQAAEEIVEAKRVLHEITGQPVSRVAIPFGSYDRHVLRRLRQAKVTRVYTSDGGVARPHSWVQPRNSLRHDLDEEWLVRTLDRQPTVATRARKFATRQVKRRRGQP
jgi:peptidoglycan/xylan/chitin deacetylase (PgdA/CDA1 family)